jgi:hypothetical protein
VYEVQAAESSAPALIVPIVVLTAGPPVGPPPEVPVDPAPPPETLPTITESATTSCYSSSVPASIMTAQVVFNDADLEYAMTNWNAQTWTWLVDYIWRCLGTDLCSDLPTTTITSTIAASSDTATSMTTSLARWATGTCHVNVEVDPWSGNSDDVQPFFMTVFSMTNNAGKACSHS